LNPEGKFDFKGAPEINVGMLNSHRPKVMFTPPVIKRIDLKVGASTFKYVDIRKERNFIPRLVQINNRAEKPWKIEAIGDWDFACVQYIEKFMQSNRDAVTMSTKTANAKPNLKQKRMIRLVNQSNFNVYWTGEARIRSKETVTTLICNGEGLRFTP
jgi:hypothetical protein